MKSNIQTNIIQLTEQLGMTKVVNINPYFITGLSDRLHLQFQFLKTIEKEKQFVVCNKILKEKFFQFILLLLFRPLFLPPYYHPSNFHYYL